MEPTEVERWWNLLRDEIKKLREWGDNPPKHPRATFRNRASYIEDLLNDEYRKRLVK